MSLFKKPNELEFISNVAMLIYGEPGAGKSTLALSAPKPVLFDFDGGIKRVNGAFHCPTLQMKSWDEVIEAMKELESEPSMCDTIVIDTAGKMLDYMAKYLGKINSKNVRGDGSLSLQGYGARKNMFVKFLSDCKMMNKNIVFVAHNKEEKKNDETICRPEIGGSSANDLIKELDLVGYMKMTGTKRTIYWNPQESFYAKNCCNLPDAYEVPIIVKNGEVCGKNEFLSNVFSNYRNYLKQQQEKQGQYNELIEQIKEDIATVNDVESANKAFEVISFYDPIWDSKIVAWNLLVEKTKSIGLKFNKATKQFSNEAA